MSDQTANAVQPVLREHPGGYSTVAADFLDRLAQSETTRPLVRFLDVYSIFGYHGELGQHHRWVPDNVGQQFLLAEQPDHLSAVLFALCEVTHVENYHMVELKLNYAEMLYWPATGEPIPCTHIDTNVINSIELDGKRPFLPNHADQVGALIGDNIFATACHVLSRLQYWAFQQT